MDLRLVFLAVVAVAVCTEAKSVKGKEKFEFINYMKHNRWGDQSQDTANSTGRFWLVKGGKIYRSFFVANTGIVNDFS